MAPPSDAHTSKDIPVLPLAHSCVHRKLCVAYRCPKYLYRCLTSRSLTAPVVLHVAFRNGLDVATAVFADKILLESVLVRRTVIIHGMCSAIKQLCKSSVHWVAATQSNTESSARFVLPA